MLPGIIPILHSFGVIIPGQFGPISLELLFCKTLFTFIISRTGIPSVIHTINSISAFIASMIAAPANFGVSDNDRYVQYNGETVDRLALNSQVRFQNDLLIDNLTPKLTGDFDNDGTDEIYWKTNDGTAYLRTLMHDDGNIKYANYQSFDEMNEYLTSNNFHNEIQQII